MALTAVLASVEVGQYINPWKVLVVAIILLGWARLLVWVDKDAPAAHLPRQIVNVGMWAVGLFGFVLLFILPSFTAAFPALLFIILASFGAYLFIRYQKAGLGDLTGEFQGWMKGVTTRDRKVAAVQGQVQFTKSDGNLMPPPDAESPELAGYEAVQAILVEPLRRGADELSVTPAEGGSRVSYMVDGVVFPGDPIDKAGSAAAITYLKTVAGMDVEDKRKPKTGKLKLMVDGQRKELAMHTAGSSAGENLRLVTESKQRYERRVEELGFSEAQLKLIQDVVADKGGIVIVTVPKEQGLTSTLYGMVRAHDAFQSHIQTLERQVKQDLEGVTQNRLAPNITPAEEEKQVDWVVSQEPDVMMISQIDDPRSARHLIRYGASGRRAYVGMRAANTTEALAAWRKLVGDDKLAVEQLKMIIAGRLVRRLCSACKIGYAPDPTTLRKLNMDPHKVSKLFQARTESLRDAKGNPVACEFCKDLRFKGRFGIYEILVVSDEVREVVMAGGSANQLKGAFRQQRGKFLQEAALEKVEEGETSVQEVLRALRLGEPQAQTGGAKPAAPRAPATPSRPG